MDFALNEEQLAVTELATRLFSDLATHETMREIELNGDPLGPFHAALWTEVANAGLLSLEVPEADGGAGLDIISTVQVLRQVGATAAYVPVAEQTQLAIFPLVTFGTEAQKATYLDALTAGRLLATAALVEVNGGRVDLGGSHPRVTATPSGDGFVLSGAKACVPGGVRAGLFLIPAATPSGVIVALVPADADGVVVTAQAGTYVPEAQVALSEVHISADQILGGAGADGVAQIAAMTDRYTVALCAIEAGATAASLKLAASYTTTREQFGKAIATFQAVGQRVADAYVDSEAISLTMTQAAWLLAAGRPAEREIATAKWWASEGADRVVHACVHVHGGVGVDRDYPLHRYFMLTRQLFTTLGGPTDQLRRLGSALAR